VRYRYWDSCCFLGWLKEEPDKLGECEAGIRLAERGKLVLVTSALTLAEVLSLKGKNPIPVADREKVRRFFENAYIDIYDVDRAIAEAAQDAVWNYGIAPKDAIHVATAISTARDLGIEQLDTFDNALIGHSRTIGNPPLVIGRPSLPVSHPGFDGDFQTRISVLMGGSTRHGTSEEVPR